MSGLPVPDGLNIMPPAGLRKPPKGSKSGMPYDGNGVLGTYGAYLLGSPLVILQKCKILNLEIQTNFYFNRFYKNFYENKNKNKTTIYYFRKQKKLISARIFFVVLESK